VPSGRKKVLTDALFLPCYPFSPRSTTSFSPSHSHLTLPFRRFSPFRIFFFSLGKCPRVPWPCCEFRCGFAPFFSLFRFPLDVPVMPRCFLYPTGLFAPTANPCRLESPIFFQSTPGVPPTANTFPPLLPARTPTPLPPSPHLKPFCVRLPEKKLPPWLRVPFSLFVLQRGRFVVAFFSTDFSVQPDDNP